MIRIFKVAQVSIISRATKKKLLEFRGRRVKASTMTPSFYCGFSMSHKKHLAVNCAKFKKHLYILFKGNYLNVGVLK